MTDSTEKTVETPTLLSNAQSHQDEKMRKYFLFKVSVLVLLGVVCNVVGKNSQKYDFFKLTVRVSSHHITSHLV